ncbi:MAG: helix-turn-helix domain-containing protein [Zunongwangia sp.]|uniref:helix-turn-helix domain-containing protein n=1 Tax=Zunongwangia sp. TaxID=1965325 RepID=UPI003242C344
MEDVTQLQVQGITAEKFFESIQSLREEILELKTAIAPKKKEEYLTKLDVAKLLKVHPNTIDNYVEKGYLKTYKIYGKRLLYKRSEVEASLTPID